MRLLLEIGDLYLDKLEDPPQASGAFRAGLELQPDNLKLLHRCLNLYVEQKAWSQAMDTLYRLISVEQLPAARAKYRYTAGMICLEQLARFGEAADHLWASLEDDPSLERSATALEEMLRNHKSWKELARYYQFALKHLPAADPHAQQLRLWSALGELYHDHLNDPASALVAYEVALRFDQTNSKRRQQLATLYTEAGPAHLDKAIAEHQALLRADKGRLASYRALAELYLQIDQPAKSAACNRALACLKEDDEPRPEPEAAITAVRHPLTEELWAQLRHPDEDPHLSALFAAISPVIAAAQAQRQRLTLQRKRCVPRDDPRPFARAFKLTCEALGVPAPELYLAPEQPEPVTFSTCIDGQRLVPVLTLGQSLLDVQRVEREVLFELGRRVALLRPERFIRWLLPLPLELAHLLDAAMAISARPEGGAPPTGELGKTTEGLRRDLSPVALDLVVSAGHRLRALKVQPDAAALAWLQASDLTASRVGLLLSGDVERCARLLKHEAAPPSARPPAQRVLDLIWSSVTEELFAARRHVIG